jgi:hypothetical protein
MATDQRQPLKDLIDEAILSSQRWERRFWLLNALWLVVALAAAGIFGYSVSQFTDTRKEIDELVKRLQRVEATLGEQVKQSLQGYSNNITTIERKFEELKRRLRIGSVQDRLHYSSTWKAKFPFKVIGAFVVPTEHFENIKGIDPIDPAEDIQENVVRFRIRKTAKDALVGVRIVAFGFGEASDTMNNQ